MLTSFEELCIMRVAAVNSFAIVLNPQWGSVYIYIERESNQKGRIYYDGKSKLNVSILMDYHQDFSVDRTTIDFYQHLVSLF